MAESANSRAQTLTPWVAFATALLVLIGTAIGLFKTNDARQAADSTVSSQSQTIASFSAAGSSADQVNGELKRSVAVLSAQLATATAATTVTVTTTSSVVTTTAPTAPSFTTESLAPTTRNPNPISLVPGSPHIDLDSTNTNWATDPANEAGADLSYYSPEDRLAMGYGARMSLLKATPANYENCKASYSAMSSGEEFINKFKVGDNVCVFTGEMRYVALVVTSVTGGISFNATSYDPPGR